MKEYSESCDQNRDPILAILRVAFAGAREVLEIGSGTGQHAVYFSRHLPHLRWHTSDRASHHASILAWMDAAGLGNVVAPIHLDVNQPHWPARAFDAVFSANTAHIMHWDEVVRMFAGVARMLRPGGIFCLYGPFNYNHTYTSASNERFDAWLKTRDPDSGIRDFEALNELAGRHGLQLQADHAMPANNRTLQWLRVNGGTDTVPGS